MDKIKKYQEILTRLLTEYVSFLSGSNAAVMPQMVADVERNHFQLVKIGWDNQRNQFVFGILFHFDIIGDKVWLQLNNTEFQVIDEIIEMGVSKDDIVFGFQPPAMHNAAQAAVPQYVAHSTLSH